jgi:hypothetical protein
MIALKTEAEPFAGCNFHVVERGLNIGNSYHFQ